MCRGLHGEWPEDWDDCLGALARFFRFQPSELWAMDREELTFWLDQADRLAGAETGTEDDD